jgi:hypothetical protein
MQNKPLPYHRSQIWFVLINFSLISLFSLTVIVLGMLLSSLTTPQYREDRVTREFNSNIFSVRFTASTNCAQPGDEVVFKAQVHNLTDQSLLIRESPPFDIVIEAYSPTTTSVLQRWSNTDQYPKQIEPVLAPGENRTFTWRWIADAVYTTGSGFHDGVLVSMPVTGQIQGKSNISGIFASQMMIGVGSHPTLAGRPVSCASLKRSFFSYEYLSLLCGLGFSAFLLIWSYRKVNENRSQHQ